MGRCLVDSKNAMLFQSIKVGPLQLKNRMVFVPFETNFATEDSYPTERHVSFYERVAAGGVGLIIMEAVNVNPKMIATKYGMGLTDDKYIDSFNKMVERIHRHGTPVVLQIADKSLLNTHRTPEDLTHDEIYRLIDYFVETTKRVEKAGFDGVEYHGCHLYTLADFMSRENTRKDEFGKGLEGRMKMSKEILTRSRDQVGEKFALFFRINGDEFIPGANTLKDAMEIAKELEGMGCDAIDVSAGGRIEKWWSKLESEGGKWGGWSMSYSAWRVIPGQAFPDAANMHLPEGIKKAVSIPVIGAGKIGNAALAEQLLQERKADLIGFGRAIFADPDFPVKSMEGREKEIIRCTWCNHCHKIYTEDKQVDCLLWPKDRRLG
jgi:2,4-dienoyl-CoA reductase-like NADH-dependent reductase (Old Yellow Enzyme family)